MTHLSLFYSKGNQTQQCKPLFAARYVQPRYCSALLLAFSAYQSFASLYMKEAGFLSASRRCWHGCRRLNGSKVFLTRQMDCFPNPPDLFHLLVWERAQKIIVKGRSAPKKKKKLEGNWMILLSIRFKAGKSDYVTAS